MLGEIKIEEKIKSAIQKLVNHLIAFESEGWVKLLRTHQDAFEENDFSSAPELNELLSSYEYSDLLLTHKWKAEEEMDKREMLNANKLKNSLACELQEFLKQL